MLLELFKKSNFQIDVLAKELGVSSNGPLLGNATHRKCELLLYEK